MYRVLIADYDADFAELLRKQIGNGFQVNTCGDKDTLLAAISDFDPDVIVMDAFLSGVDGWGTLQILADTGRMPRIIITTRNSDVHTVNRLAKLGVINLFVKPCKICAVAACINEICTASQFGVTGAWCVENEIDNILLRMGFQIGTKGYNAVYKAILMRYEEPEATVTKHIYPILAKTYGVDTRCIEKRLRDSIKAAFTSADMNVWKCFFHPDMEGMLHCPSNDIFFARIAGGLHQRTRLNPPCRPVKQKNA